MTDSHLAYAAFAYAIAKAPAPREQVDFKSHEWGRLYRGTYGGLRDAGIVDRVPEGFTSLIGQRFERFAAYSPDRRDIEIRQKRRGVFDVKWPYKDGEASWLPANQQHLVQLSEQAQHIANLIIRASTEIASKSELRDWATADSSKLARAMEDLEYASTDIANLMEAIRVTSGLSEDGDGGDNDADDDDDDDDDRDNGDDHPILPTGPSPSGVTTR
jgi:hypothetical protein